MLKKNQRLFSRIDVGAEEDEGDMTGFNVTFITKGKDAAMFKLPPSVKKATDPIAKAGWRFEDVENVGVDRGEWWHFLRKKELK